MTQDIPSSATAVRKLHAGVLKRRRLHNQEFLLNEKDFRFAAECERMRVDRNGSVLALLLVRLSKPKAEETDFFLRVLEGRIRVTDTPGLIEDGRIAILLPDTNAEGAWTVATDISEVYPPGPGRPECEVLVYPGQKRDHDFSSEDDYTSKDDYDSNSPGPLTNGSEKKSNAKTATQDPKVQSEFFFARSQPIWKRSLDIVGATIGLGISLPILAVAAAAVKTTSQGPAFFKQNREGHGGKQFAMWKLRTMQVDAEQKKHALRELSHQDGPAFKMKKDPRTTTVGRFLRWTSMDELPQFWNVLKGDMSLVGPRPLPVEESSACEGWQRRRLQVRPGMTCTWQVSERGNVSFDEWVRMDLRYTKKVSFFEDIRLLVMTLPSLLLQRGMR